ncbi:MAG: ClbS/DfsB family four-helix bundle protein [Chloroflexi bacterium]|jgi:uncharacterized protein (TIGR03083 family)|nr:ClbS/DfsB family four-helix bundle protein [Chloroflexota bacterium]MBV6438213.1 hypothetical protein [Anaerolineae bacterium]MDL1917315.1 ClbS/DfsB family four-helix bundle protein [Anaerolineae bacterium CFX4]OQY79852.1 MAG: hypothetical protein B6D42_14215 [Anaerolineae bacterium UTCFX5]MCC6567477.1 ClbS/DfsB family four-helix bundle protein [Chloroflexota bacterium]
MTDEESITKAGVLTELDHEWSVLQAFIATLTDAQMTVPTDDAGWTVKDHLIHLVLWLYNVPAIIDGASRPEAMGISEEKFREGADAINAWLQPQYRDVPLADVLQRLNDTHARIRARLDQMTDEDLRRPYNHYQPSDPRTAPVVGWLLGNSAHHYSEHLPWMQAIAARLPS